MEKLIYSDLKTIDMSNEEIQKDLIRNGCMVGMPGGEMMCKKSVTIIAGKSDESQK
jgi:hypothetical protein